MKTSKLLHLLQTSPFILIISFNISLNAKLELENTLSKFNFTLNFISSKQLYSISKNYKQFESFAGLANGTLYFITQKNNNSLLNSKNKYQSLFGLLNAYSPIIYGVRWNSLLYTASEAQLLLSHAKNTIIPYNLVLQYYLIYYTYLCMCYILINNNYSKHSNIYNEETYVYY